MSSAASLIDKFRTLYVQSALKISIKVLNIATIIQNNFEVICTASRFMREKLMVMSSVGLGTTNYCADEAQKKIDLCRPEVNLTRSQKSA
jgi:hypothetical protein